MHAAATSISLSVARSSQCRRALLLLLAVDDDDLVVLAHGRGVALEKMMAALLDSSRHRPMSSGTTWRSPSYDWRFRAARAAAAAASGRGVVAASTSRSRRGRIHGGAQIPPPAFASSSLRCRWGQEDASEAMESSSVRSSEAMEFSLVRSRGPPGANAGDRTPVAGLGAGSRSHSGSPAPLALYHLY